MSIIMIPVPYEAEYVPAGCRKSRTGMFLESCPIEIPDMEQKLKEDVIYISYEYDQNYHIALSEDGNFFKNALTTLNNEDIQIKDIDDFEKQLLNIMLNRDDPLSIHIGINKFYGLDNLPRQYISDEIKKVISTELDKQRKNIQDTFSKHFISHNRMFKKSISYDVTHNKFSDDTYNIFIGKNTLKNEIYIGMDETKVKQLSSGSVFKFAPEDVGVAMDYVKNILKENPELILMTPESRYIDKVTYNIDALKTFGSHSNVKELIKQELDLNKVSIQLQNMTPELLECYMCYKKAYDDMVCEIDSSDILPYDQIEETIRIATDLTKIVRKKEGTENFTYYSNDHLYKIDAIKKIIESYKNNRDSMITIDFKALRDNANSRILKSQEAKTFDEIVTIHLSDVGHRLTGP